MSTVSTSNATKPTVVFVPGAFHTPAHFEPISALLQASSYPTVSISLPSIGEKAATSSLHDDVNAIRSTLEHLAEEEGKEIVLVVHSYGGVPGCQTVGGLEKSKRIKEGKKGGISQVLFLTAFVLEEGQSVVEGLGGGLPPWAKAEGSILHPVNTLPIFYSLLSTDEADHYTSLLLPQSALPSTVPIKDVCYDLDVPITYLLCNGDPAIGIFEGMLEKVKRPAWKVERIDGDHCPFLSNKQGVIGIIEGCVAASTT